MLYLLCGAQDTGVALESEEESKGAMVRLQQRLTMRNLGNVEETTEIPVYVCSIARALSNTRSSAVPQFRSSAVPQFR